MSLFRSLFTGLLTAAASTLIVLGGISLALAEGFTLSAPPTPTPTQPGVVLQPGETRQPVTPAPTQQAVIATSTPVLATTCPVPQGWSSYTVQPGESLLSLALMYHTTVADLMRMNCLVTQSVLPGTLLSVPGIAPTPLPFFFPTPTTAPCGPPYGWVRYIVQPGDSLFAISIRVGTSVPQLQAANCMGSNDYTILAGQALWVPFLPPPPVIPPTQPPPFWTDTPIPVVTDTVSPVPTTETATATTPVPPSETPTTPVPDTATTQPPSSTVQAPANPSPEPAATTQPAPVDSGSPQSTASPEVTP